MNNNVLVGGIAFVAGAVISPLVVTWLLVRYVHKTVDELKQDSERSRRDVELPVWNFGNRVPINTSPINTMPMNTSPINLDQCEDGLKTGSVIEL